MNQAWITSLSLLAQAEVFKTTRPGEVYRSAGRACTHFWGAQVMGTGKTLHPTFVFWNLLNRAENLPPKANCWFIAGMMDVSCSCWKVFGRRLFPAPFLAWSPTYCWRFLGLSAERMSICSVFAAQIRFSGTESKCIDDRCPWFNLNLRCYQI